MDQNSAALECLILFYIDKKHALKVKQLDERNFNQQMIDHCKQSGFDCYSDGVIIQTWYNLVTKYNHLKIKGTNEERECWKYFEILDSCYELSDFQNDVRSKFSEDMVWFLIECFLKRKICGKAQKRTNLMDEIYKEMLENGYLHIMKTDIENKWKYLNAKYDKLKNNPDNFKKFPFLQALKGFRELDENVDMVFTTELTKKLIEFYTEKKITCIIHGYDSDKVLSEIQLKFISLGFNFTKEEIKEKWKSLTNIYKFLLAKGKKESSWIYFNDIQNHFKDSFLISSCDTDDSVVNKINDTKIKSLRPRSKSIGAEMRKRCFDETCLFINIEDDTVSPSKKVYKAPVENRGKRNSIKKLKNGSLNTSLQEDLGKMEENLLKPVQKKEADKFTSQAVKNSSINKEIHSKLRSLRPRSKSVCPEQFNKDLGETDTSINVEDSLTITNDRDTKNPFENRGRSRSPRKHTLEKKNESEQIQEKEVRQRKSRQKYSIAKILHLENNSGQSDNITISATQSGIQSNNRLNIDSEIEIETIDLVSDSKNYSDNEFLPLKKRIRTSAKSTDKLPSVSDHLKDQLRKTTESAKNSVDCENCDEIYTLCDCVQCSKIQKEEQTPVSTQADIEAQPPILSPQVCLKDSTRKQTEVDSTANVIKCNSADSDKTIDSSDFVDSNCPKIETVGQTEHIPTTSTKINNPVKNNSEIESEIVCDSQTVDRNSECSLQSGQITTNFITSPGALEVNQSKSDNFDKPTVLEGNTNIESVPVKTSASKVRLPVKVGGKLKEIFILPSELNKISKFTPIRNLCKPNEASVAKNINVTVNQSSTGIKFLSQVVKPAVTLTESEPVKQKDSKLKDSSANVSVEDFSCNVNQNRKEIENKTRFSKGVEEDGLKDNLLATVIDFQEQNNQEFIEIKNLMKQNNLLQRETNRLLRLMLEKM